MRRLIRQPLLHFLVLGALLFALQSWMLASQPPPSGDDSPIRIDGDEIAQLRSDWLRDSGRAPSDAELRASIGRRVDEEVLLREALRLELDVRDPVARERLLRNMRFAYPQRRAADDALLHEARALGMSQRDLVVRRRLIQAMERRLTAAVPYDEAALRDYIADHGERYGGAGRHAFRHIFFSGDRPGGAASAQAEAVRAQLARSPQPAADAGDPFLLGTQFPPASAAEIAARFGDAFAQAVAQAPVGVWSGPLRSPYGLHLIRVDERVPARVPDFERIRTQAAQAWLAEQRSQVLREQLQQLHRRYRVDIATGPLAKGGA